MFIQYFTQYGFFGNHSSPNAVSGHNAVNSCYVFEDVFHV